MHLRALQPLMEWSRLSAWDWHFLSELGLFYSDLEPPSGLFVGKEEHPWGQTLSAISSRLHSHLLFTFLVLLGLNRLSLVKAWFPPPVFKTLQFKPYSHKPLIMLYIFWLKFQLNMRKNFYTLGVTEHWNRLPRRLWILLLWRYSRPAWTRSCAACCRWPCFGREVGLDDPQRSHPTPTIL